MIRVSWATVIVGWTVLVVTGVGAFLAVNGNVTYGTFLATMAKVGIAGGLLGIGRGIYGLRKRGE